MRTSEIDMTTSPLVKWWSNNLIPGRFHVLLSYPFVQVSSRWRRVTIHFDDFILYSCLSDGLLSWIIILIAFFRFTIASRNWTSDPFSQLRSSYCTLIQSKAHRKSVKVTRKSLSFEVMCSGPILKMISSN